MSVIERTVKILSIRTVGETVYLDLLDSEPSLIPHPHVPKPENIIQPIPKTDSEKTAREITKAMVDELKRAGMPTTSQFPMQGSTRLHFSLALSKEEFEKFGKPNVYNELKLTINVLRKTTRSD